MSTIEVVVCHVCEEIGKATLPYTVGQGRRRAKVDLCEDDAAFLEALLPGTATPRVKRRDVSQGRRGRGVMSMEDVERARMAALARKQV